MSSLAKTADRTARDARFSFDESGIVPGESSGINLPVDVVQKAGSDLVSGISTTESFALVKDQTQISDADLRALGYLLVNDYPGVDPLGATDSLAGIHAAINDSRDLNRPLWASAESVYLVSDSVRCFMWDKDTGGAFSPTNPLQIFGGGRGATRPKIVLQDGATNMQNAADPRPIFVFRNFQLSGDGVEPTDVLDDTGIFQSQANNYFYATFQNFQIDCGNNAGAFGVYFPAAQRCFAADIEIDATNAQGGWYGLLGRDCPIMNLKVIGGVEQLITDLNVAADGNAGTCLAGLTLVADSRTEVGIISDDFVPLTVVGFDFQSNGASSVDWLRTGPTAGTGKANLIAVDGKVVLPDSASRVLDNANGKNSYLRNIYVNGSDNLIQSGSEGIVTGTGTWKRIAEYVYTDQTAINVAAGSYENESLIDGTVSGAAEPSTTIQNSVSAPTTDYIAEHTIEIERVDDGPFVNVLDHGATPVAGSNINTNQIYRDGLEPADSLAAFQAAVSAANTAGHNRVVVPYGFFAISGILDLLPNTKMIGVSALHSKIGVTQTWLPTAKVYVVRTADDPNGTCHWSELQIAVRTIGTVDSLKANPFADPPDHDWFSWIHWRTGKFSTSVQRIRGKETTSDSAHATQPHDYQYFTDNGGGRHFGLTDQQGRWYSHPDAIGIRIEGTSQPLHIYGYNPEMSKGGPSSQIETLFSAIISNASNIRIYNTKREGTSSTMKLNNVNNFAHYGSGRDDPGAGITNGINASHSVFGNSDDFLFTNIVQDAANQTGGANEYMSYEDVTGFAAVGIVYPNGVSLHKRGEPDDSLVRIT